MVQHLGAGSVGQFSAPFGHPALRALVDPAAFWADLLHTGPTLPNGFAPDGMNPDGFLESNLASALTGLPALEFPSLTLLGLLLCVYILIVGPGMYLLLRRLDQQMFGWIAVPLVTLLFAGLAYGIGHAQRGGDVLLNQITLIEGLSGSPDQARIRTFAGLFSPTRAEYTLSGSAALVRPISLQGPWTPAGQGGGLFVQEAPFGPRVEDIVVEQWSMSAVAADTIGQNPGLAAQIRIDSDAVRAEVENRGDQPVRDVAVVQGELVARLGDLAPAIARK
ncbi:MAG: hypothetical protein HC822_26415 [Oscillochloris sp.]|nr:hypothetical protein [Oscillochloris sp.]